MDLHEGDASSGRCVVVVKDAAQDNERDKAAVSE